MKAVRAKAQHYFSGQTLPLPKTPLEILTNDKLHKIIVFIIANMVIIDHILIIKENNLKPLSTPTH
jgi:hypothetical protein